MRPLARMFTATSVGNVQDQETASAEPAGRA